MLVAGRAPKYTQTIWPLFLFYSCLFLSCDDWLAAHSCVCVCVCVPSHAMLSYAMLSHAMLSHVAGMWPTVWRQGAIQVPHGLGLAIPHPGTSVISIWILIFIHATDLVNLHLLLLDGWPSVIAMPVSRPEEAVGSCDCRQGLHLSPRCSAVQCNDALILLSLSGQKRLHQ